MKTPVYLDNHSTTPVDPRVLDAMLPYFCDKFGNAGSTSHPFGWEAKEAVDQARQQVAVAIGAQPREIIFTSGATESNNLAIRGLADWKGKKGRHLISVATEHARCWIRWTDSPAATLRSRCCPFTPTNTRSSDSCVWTNFRMPFATIRFWFP